MKVRIKYKYDKTDRWPYKAKASFGFLYRNHQYAFSNESFEDARERVIQDVLAYRNQIQRSHSPETVNV